MLRGVQRSAITPSSERENIFPVGLFLEVSLSNIILSDILCQPLEAEQLLFDLRCVDDLGGCQFKYCTSLRAFGNIQSSLFWDRLHSQAFHDLETILWQKSSHNFLLEVE
jgi:hypothetical protein